MLPPLSTLNLNEVEITSSGCHVLRVSAPLILALSYLVLASSSIVAAEDLDELVGPLIRDLEELQRRHVDVRVLVEELDKAITLWDSGDRGEALRIIEDVRVEISKLKAESSRVYAIHVSKLALEILVLLATPIAFYTLFPRVYLWLWFHSRRNWIVVRKGAPRR